MYHVINVGMNADVLRQLDSLRSVYPEARNRSEIINRLIQSVHANITQQDANSASLPEASNDNRPVIAA